MKTFILLSTLLSSFTALSCSCSEYALSHSPAIRDYLLAQNVRETVSKEQIEWVAHHPSLPERLLIGSIRGTSCEIKGPQGEPVAYCGFSRKSDYRIKLEKCEILLRVKSDREKVSFKELTSTCEKN